MRMPLPDSASSKAFLTRFFASFGILCAFLLLVFALAAKMWLSAPAKEAKTPDSMLLTLDFTLPVAEKPRGLSLTRLLDENKETPLYALVRAIDKAKDDPRVKGIAARFGTGEKPSLSQVQEIATALARFRASGKPTYAFAPSYGSFGPGGALYALAAQFEHIWLQPIGSVGLTAIGIEAPFGKTALEKIGIQADFMRREDYKSMMENAARDSFSPAVRENMQSMLDSIQTQIVDLIAGGLKKKPEDVRALLARGPFTANEAIQEGLVSKLGYEDEMHKEIKEATGDRAEKVEPSSYLAFRAREDKTEAKADVALIYAEGMIPDSASRSPSRFAADDMIDAEEIAKAFEKATENPKIKAILFRVSSPGGSPTASETIRRAVVKAKESGRPVYVSMGPVAASGGYWIAMEGNRIFASPGTITGSIGVVAGKFVLGGLYDKIGITWDSLGAEDSARLWSSRRPFGPKERARMDAMLDETYNAFLQNVSAARKIPMDKMPAVAKGRVFTGAQAIESGLIDGLGGMDTALKEIKKELKLSETDKIALRLYPEQETFKSIAMKILHEKGLIGAFFSTNGFAQIGAEALRPLLPFLNGIESDGAVRATMPASFMKMGW